MIFDWLFLILSYAFMLTGCYFIFASSVGFLRMKNAFAKIHAVAFSNIYGVTSLLLGLAIHSGLSLITIKILVVALFNMIVTLSVVHVIMRRAYADKEPLEAKTRR